MSRLLFYVSGHGFGHATRIAALTVALRGRARTPLEIHVRSEAPEWLLRERNPELRYSSAPLDVGMLQPNGLDLELERTLAAHEAFVRDFDSAVEREARFIRALAPDLVVSDVPALAFPSARRAETPGVAIANFSWDWILDFYAAAEPRFGAIAAHYREAYGQAQRLFRLPLHGDLSAFSARVDTPLLVNRSSSTPAEARAALGLPEADPRKLVLCSFGGFGSSPFVAADGEDLSAYAFIGMGAAPTGFPGDWLALERPFPVAHEDLIQACDAVLGKTGYSTVAEVLAHGKRMLYLSRPDFAEAVVIEAELEALGCARALPRDDFEAGRWCAHLDALFTETSPAPIPPANGAEFIADALLASL